MQMFKAIIKIKPDSLMFAHWLPNENRDYIQVVLTKRQGISYLYDIYNPELPWDETLTDMPIAIDGSHFDIIMEQFTHKV